MPNPEPSGRLVRRLSLGLGVLLLIGAVALGANLPKRPQAVSANAVTPSASSSEQPASPQPTPTPVAGTTTAQLGAAVGVAYKGVETLSVTVSKVQFANRYQDAKGRYSNTPTTKGDVYMAVLVTYTGVGPNADYNPLDWAIYVKDLPGPPSTFVFYGPKPVLQSRRLPEGRSAAGWIVYEVPATGRITISYQPRRGTSIFEVSLRSG